MAQFQPEVPHPWRDDLPALLTAGSMTTPPVGILFLILIGQGILASTAMELERHHIGSRESLLGQMGEEKLGDDSLASDADPTLALGGRMGCDHDPA